MSDRKWLDGNEIFSPCLHPGLRPQNGEANMDLQNLQGHSIFYSSNNSRGQHNYPHLISEEVRLGERRALPEALEQADSRARTPPLHTLHARQVRSPGKFRQPPAVLPRRQVPS